MGQLIQSNLIQCYESSSDHMFNLSARIRRGRPLLLYDIEQVVAVLYAQ